MLALDAQQEVREGAAGCHQDHAVVPSRGPTASSRTAYDSRQQNYIQLIWWNQKNLSSDDVWPTDTDAFCIL